MAVKSVEKCQNIEVKKHTRRTKMCIKQWKGWKFAVLEKIMTMMDVKLLQNVKH